MTVCGRYFDLQMYRLIQFSITTSELLLQLSCDVQYQYDTSRADVLIGAYTAGH